MIVVGPKYKGCAIFIARPSVYGNPYKIGRDGGRIEVVQKYEVYARGNRKLLQEIKALLNDAVLQCYCAPLLCHGDIIVKLWLELQDKTVDEILACGVMKHSSL